MPAFTLWYWLRGPDLFAFDTVVVLRDAKIIDLKERFLTSTQLVRVRPANLRIYKVPDEHSQFLGDDDLKHNLGKLCISRLGIPLHDVNQLSVLFTPRPKENYLHLIIDIMTLPMNISCYFRGEHPAKHFIVKLPKSELMGHLNTVLTQSPGRLHHQPLEDMILYKIPSKDDDDELKKILDTQGEGDLIPLRQQVVDAFNNVPFSSQPSVVVEIREVTLTGSAKRSEREDIEDSIEVVKRMRHDFATLPMQAPSLIATPSYFQKYCQKKQEPPIRCGRPDGNQSTFPLVLAHPIFATFVSECETYEPNHEDLTFIFKLSQHMCQSYRDEIDLRNEFRACMVDYGIRLTETKIHGTDYTTDGDARVGNLPYLISEAKLDFGSEGDAYIQVAAHHLAATQNHLSTHPDELRALPCMLIFYYGPAFGFAGSMLTGKFDVNILGPMLPLFYHPTDMDMQIRCAKMFGAFKNAAAALKEYYENDMPWPHVDTRFPWIQQYNTICTPTETREFKYVREMEGGNLLFICKHVHNEQRILVKFVRTYSADAHLVSATNDGAPALLGYCDACCGWSVVIMELLEESDWVSGLQIVEKAKQRMVCGEVRKHLSNLHQRGFVHGDIRPQNILVKQSKVGQEDVLSVHLVDFDWSGHINEARYPLMVNPNLGHGFIRPRGVEGGSLITKEHDLAMVDLMYPAQCP